MVDGAVLVIGADQETGVGDFAVGVVADVEARAVFERLPFHAEDVREHLLLAFGRLFCRQCLDEGE